MTPEESHQEAAKSFYNRILSDSKQLDNMRHYCRELSRQFCDGVPYEPSKEIRLRYGLSPNENNIVWAILEEFFKNKIEPKIIVTTKDIEARSNV